MEKSKLKNFIGARIVNSGFFITSNQCKKLKIIRGSILKNREIKKKLSFWGIPYSEENFLNIFWEIVKGVKK